MGLDICRIHLCSNSESLNRPVCVAVASNDPNSISCSEYRLSDFTNWYPRYSHSDMNDNIRLRLNKAIETTDSKEFVDIAYKLGLFLTKGEDD